jgi:PII-like signaling protein
MKMLPDANGTAVSFVHDVPTSNTFQATLTGLHIEDMTDLDVVVFIQNATTKAIMQAKVATEALATHQVVGETKYKIYPNPSTGIIKIQTEVPVAIQIVDVTGKVVYVANQVQNESQINLTSLEKGVYIAKMKGENGIEESQKIIIK